MRVRRLVAVWPAVAVREIACAVFSRSANLVAAMAAIASLLACSASVIEVDSTTGVPNETGSQGALVESATGDSELDDAGTPDSPMASSGDATQLLGIELLIAFMDACTAEADLVGPCHCAASRLEGSFTAIDLKVLEDRMSGALEFPPELATALVDCREASAPPPWPEDQQFAYLDACSEGSDRLGSLCACSLARAQEVVPAHRLSDFLASNEVQPDIVDFVNPCI